MALFDPQTHEDRRVVGRYVTEYMGSPPKWLDWTPRGWSEAASHKRFKSSVDVHETLNGIEGSGELGLSRRTHRQRVGTMYYNTGGAGAARLVHFTVLQERWQIIA